MKNKKYTLEQLQDDNFYDSVCIDTYLIREKNRNTYYLDILRNRQFAICKNENIVAVFSNIEQAIEYMNNLI